MTAFSHPNILRAVYIDQHNHEAGFLTDFVCFLVHLRNYGISDNGLLMHLSEILTGSIYSGVEHSTIYDEIKVYQYACSSINPSGFYYNGRLTIPRIKQLYRHRTHLRLRN